VDMLGSILAVLVEKSGGKDLPVRGERRIGDDVTRRVRRPHVVQGSVVRGIPDPNGALVEWPHQQQRLVGAERRTEEANVVVHTALKPATVQKLARRDVPL